MSSNVQRRPPRRTRLRRPDRAKKRLLVVEDNAIIRSGLAVILQCAGFEVTPAADGQEAIDRLEEGPRPDVILLDMLMPVLDGWHFLEILRGKAQPTPPIIVTPGTILTREWASSNGCAGFVRKPIEPEDLLCEIDRCMGR